MTRITTKKIIHISRGNNNKDEGNSPKTLNDKNHQASSQKFRQQTLEEGRGHIGRNVVEITNRKPLINGIIIELFVFDRI